MPSTIRFTGAILKNFTCGTSKQGKGTYTRMHFNADFSKPVRDVMGWEDHPKGYGAADLRGQLAGVKMTLKPSKRELAEQAFEMPITVVDGFSVSPLKQKDDKPDVLVLSLTVLTMSKKAYMALGKWKDTLGEAEAHLTIEYSDEDQATLVPSDVTATEDQRQRVLGTEG